MSEQSWCGLLWSILVVILICRSLYLECKNEHMEQEMDKLVKESDKIPQCYLDLLDVHHKTIADMTEQLKSAERRARLGLHLELDETADRMPFKHQESDLGG